MKLASQLAAVSLPTLLLLSLATLTLSSPPLPRSNSAILWSTSMYVPPWAPLYVFGAACAQTNSMSNINNTYILAGFEYPVSSTQPVIMNELWYGTLNATDQSGTQWYSTQIFSGGSPNFFNHTITDPSYSASFSANNTLIVYGGGAATQAGTVYYSIDHPAHQTWQIATTMAPFADRTHFASTAVPGANHILVAAGMGNGDTQSTFANVDGVGANWNNQSMSVDPYPANLADAAMVAFNLSYVLLSGGNVLNGYYNQLWLTQNLGMSWTLLTPNASWPARSGHSMLVDNDGVLYVAFGSGPAFQFSDVWYSLDGGMTFQLLPTSPASSTMFTWISSSCVAISQDTVSKSLIVYTGSTNTANITVIQGAIINVFSSSSSSSGGGASSSSSSSSSGPSPPVDTTYQVLWTQNLMVPWTNDSADSCATDVDGSVFIYGTPDKSMTFNVYTGNFNHLSWTTQTNVSTQWQTVIPNFVYTANHTLVAFGDSKSGDIGVWFSIDYPYHFTWIQSAPMGSPPFASRSRYGYTSIPGAKWIIVTGGASYDSSATNSTWVSTDGAGATWTEFTNQVIPDQLRSAAMVAFNSTYVLLSGGYYFSNVNASVTVWCNTVYSSSCVNCNNSWTVLTTAAAFSGRADHSMVIDMMGNVFVIGGLADNGFLNDVYYSKDGGYTWWELLASSGSVMIDGLGDECATTIMNPTTMMTSLMVFTGTEVIGKQSLPVGLLEGDITRLTTSSSSSSTGGMMMSSSSSYIPIDPNYQVSWSVNTNVVWYTATNLQCASTMDGSSFILATNNSQPVVYTGNLHDTTTNWNTNNNASLPWIGTQQYLPFVFINDNDLVALGPNAGGQIYISRGASDPQHSKWTLAATVNNFPMDFAYTSIPGTGTIIVAGGMPMGSTTQQSWVSNDGGAANWTMYSNAGMYPDGLWGAAMVAFNNGNNGSSVLLIGGYISSNDSYSNSVWQTNDLGQTYTLVTSMAAWSARYQHAVVIDGYQTLYLVGGGANNMYTNEVWHSMDQGMTWYQLLSTSGSASYPVMRQPCVSLIDSNTLDTSYSLQIYNGQYTAGQSLGLLSGTIIALSSSSGGGGGTTDESNADLIVMIAIIIIAVIGLLLALFCYLLRRRQNAALTESLNDNAEYAPATTAAGPTAYTAM